jgi:hypothetical protein
VGEFTDKWDEAVGDLRLEGWAVLTVATLSLVNEVDI